MKALEKDTSKSLALELLEALEFLEVFTAFSNTKCPKFNLSYPIMDREGNILYDYKKQKYYKEYIWTDININELIESRTEVPCDDYKEAVTEDNSYFLFYKNQPYRMKIFYSPECYGYSSMLKDYDESTYLTCSIEKINEEIETRWIMVFGFNIESMKFLELLDIYSISKEGHVKECKEIDEIEKMLFGKQL